MKWWRVTLVFNGNDTWTRIVLARDRQQAFARGQVVAPPYLMLRGIKSGVANEIPGEEPPLCQA